MDFPFAQRYDNLPKMIHIQIICIFAAQNKAHGREQNTYRNRDSGQEHRQPLPAVGAAAVETAERSGQRQAASERLYGHEPEELHHPQVHQPLPPVPHPRLQHRHRLPHRHPRLPRDQMALHRPLPGHLRGLQGPRHASTRPTSTSPRSCKPKADSSTASTPTPATP